MKIETLYEIFLKYGKVSTDSRSVDKDSIFFALKGTNFNGNKYASEALEKGAAVCIVDEKEYYNTNDSRFILVDDCLKTLQDLAAFHRSKFNFPVIGITGTNGKTTTKELIAGALSLKYKVKATSGNLNNHIGVPLSLLSVNNIHNTDFCIIEMGANHVGEIASLCEIAKPNYGIITSIGKAHLEGFGSLENIIKTKLELYNFIDKTKGSLFINLCNEILIKNLPNNTTNIFYKDISKKIENLKVQGHEITNSVDIFCSGRLDETTMNLSFDWQTKRSEKVFHVEGKMYGRYNFINMLAAACIGNYFDVSGEDITQYLSNFESDNNRSQIIKINSNTIVSDAYNANPSSMEVALDTFNEIKVSNKILILGDMFELGNDTEKEHKKILDKLRSMNVEKVILIGKNFQQLNSEYETYLTVDEAIQNFNIQELENKNILIKGSRGMRLEKLIKI
ncbi:MAG: UDP-N-acetylmuramoyl-tripeptide--D-alanyl-D-alanine ligase [Bacteroidales bacterium]|jgi:UDP-N-acetylmuramoyl-tripeptide--D-alanyl-D-alanine ligase|nr:UDP-N-acetylmuramoyl-tripeptide--D-alanyl-D-alanine ligase [Bacteroidales bacterium]